MPFPVGRKTILNNVKLKSGIKLYPGSVIRAEVLSGSSGKVKLLWNSGIIKAESSVELKTGEIIDFKVFSEDGKIVLKPFSGEINKNQLNTFPGFYAKILPEHLKFAESLFAAGLPLPHEEEFFRRYALLKRAEGNTRRLSRLYAELLSKGLDPSADFLEHVYSLLENGNRGTSGKHLSADIQDFFQPENLKYIFQEKGQSEENPILLLLSAVNGKNGRWIFKRENIKIKERTFSLVWKIRADSPEKDLSLTISDNGRIFEFILSGTGKIKMNVYISDNIYIEEDSWKAFRERMYLINVDVSDKLSPLNEGNGFSAVPETEAGKKID